MFKITALDHVGICVLDRDRSLALYSKLGFRVDPHEDAPAYRAVGLVNDAGVRIHLIYNGVSYAEGKNPLMDQPTKWPGYTHGAVIVDSMEELVDWLVEQKYSDYRRACRRRRWTQEAVLHTRPRSERNRIQRNTRPFDLDN